MIEDEERRERHAALAAVFDGQNGPVPPNDVAVVFAVVAVPGDLEPLLASAALAGIAHLPADWYEPERLAGGARKRPLPVVLGEMLRPIPDAAGPVLVPMLMADFFALLRLRLLAAFPRARFAIVTRGRTLFSAGARFLDAHPAIDPDGAEMDPYIDAVLHDTFAVAQHEAIVSMALEAVYGRGQPTLYLEVWRRKPVDLLTRLLPGFDASSVEPATSRAMLDSEPSTRENRERRLVTRLNGAARLTAAQWSRSPLAGNGEAVPGVEAADDSAVAG